MGSKKKKNAGEERNVDLQNRLVVAGGEGGEWGGWEAWG